MSLIDYRLELQKENKQIELIKEITFLLDTLSIDKLEEIKDSMSNWDILNKNGIDTICEEITDLQWQINVNTKDF